MSLTDLAEEVVSQLKSGDGNTDRPYLSLRNATLRVVKINGIEELQCHQRGIAKIYFRNPYNAIQTFLYMGCVNTFPVNTLYHLDSIHVFSPAGNIIMSIPINLNLKYSNWSNCSRLFALLKYTLIGRPVEWQD